MAEGDLEWTREMYLRMVDGDADVQCVKYITTGHARCLFYREKVAEATAVLTMGQAAANALTEAERIASFPILAASVGIEAPTLYAAAELTQATFTAWAQLGYLIERARLAGKKAIREAPDADAIVAAYQAVTWPS